MQEAGNSVQKLKKFAAFGAMAATVVLAGCRQDMHDQPKFIPLRGTTLFDDGRSARPQVANTVARNQLRQASYFYTGLVDGKEGDGLPFPLTAEVMKRGQERFNVYCTPCHSRVGNGEGMIVQRGYAKAGDFHSDRLRSAPLGHFFHVITNGYGAMPDYASQVAPADRWAIVAYIRALQLSQNATQADVTPGAHVEPLPDIAARVGMPASFAGEWTLPATAATGTPTGQPMVLPTPGSNGSGAGTQTSAPAKPTAQPTTPGAATPRQ
jgi:mono/diheme cytochrome c family protein